MGKVTAYVNGTILTPIREIKGGVILVENEKIRDLGAAGDVEIPVDATLVDVGGCYISPGFIDTHLHGAWGGDVSTGSAEDLQLIAQGLVRAGTTGYLPTTLSGPLGQITAALERIDGALKKPQLGAKILGGHLEGPYFSLGQKGAQNPDFIIPPVPEDYLPLLENFPFIRKVSAAPELPGALELGQELRHRGIVASIAHTDATYQEILQAVENGYTHSTHIYSAMSGMHRVQAYRVTGTIESVLLLDEITTEMIADGHHLPPSLMQLVLKCKGLDKVCLITDSMSAAGLGPGEYDLGGLDVIVNSEVPDAFEGTPEAQNYVAKLTDGSSFAGSVSTMDQLVRNAVRQLGMSVLEAVKLATLNPARIHALPGVGQLAPQMQADLAIFDQDINVKMTVVDGQLAYRSQ